MTNEEFIELISEQGEKWRDVKDYESLYKVSNHGRVISLGKRVNTWYGTRYLEPRLLTIHVSKTKLEKIIVEQKLNCQI